MWGRCHDLIGASVRGNPIEDTAKLGSDPTKLLPMRGGEPRQNPFASLGQGDHHSAAILVRASSHDPLFRRESVHQAHCAVVAYLQPLGEFSDGHALSSGETLDGKQGLMLLRGKPFCGGGIFTESQKETQGIPQGCERFVVSLGKGGFASGFPGKIFGHARWARTIASQYDRFNLNPRMGNHGTRANQANAAESKFPR